MISYPLAALVLAVLLGFAAMLKADSSGGGVGIGLFFLFILLGIGGCCHLVNH